MAVTVDNSITRVNNDGGTSVTSGSFNVAAGDLLVVCGHCDQANDSTVDSLAISDNQTPDLAWVAGPTRGASESGAGLVSSWYFHSTGSITGLTVTLSCGTDNDSPSIKVYKCTGHDSADILGAVGEGNLTTDPQTTTAITAETAGAFFAAWTDWNQTGTPTSSDLTVSGFDTSGDISGASGYKATSAGSVTGNMNSGGTPVGNYITFEIRTAAGGAGDAVPVCWVSYRGRRV